MNGRGLGGTMMILGIGSFILPLFGFQFRIMEIFGNGQLYAAIALIIIGLFLLIMSTRKQ